MINDPRGVFRRMWATAGWGKMMAGSQTGFGSACWLHARDSQDVYRNQPAGIFWQETLEGKYCGENWYEGNDGRLGLRGQPPTYTAAAPALLGEDGDIGRYCANRLRQMGLNTSKSHAADCVAANTNILNLNTQRIPYNLCRNLEWQVCAAQGRLPGQGSNTVVFATPPNSLDPKPSSRMPLGQCGGWRPPQPPPDGFGYANFDILYLEVCTLDHICTNGADVWAGGPFHCQFSEERYREFQRIMSQPFVEPLEGNTSVTWSLYPSLNCWWDGHGAEEVDSPRGSAVGDRMTLDECKAACSLHASCEGVIVPAGASGAQRVACYRKARLRTRHCQRNAEFDLHARTGWSRAVPVGTHASGAAMPLAGRLTSVACDAMLANKDDKLWAAFGQGPTVRQPLDPPCFGVGKEAGEWWELALQGRTPRHERMLRGCDVNWAGEPFNHWEDCQLQTRAFDR